MHRSILNIKNEKNENYMNNYFKKLSSSKNKISFSSMSCKYGKFTIYCIIGPEENIVHLTLAPGKHAKASNQLSSIGPNILVKELGQKDFPYNAIFRDYFNGKLRDFSIKVDSPFFEAGTDFQKKVWSSIKTVPYGGSITYQQLAKLAGSPKGTRAAGSACGANPVALIIPCHRIVAMNRLGGYAGGIANKKALLSLEGSILGK
jgi:O-6-methylguanine DNA methyltransferase